MAPNKSMQTAGRCRFKGCYQFVRAGGAFSRHAIGRLDSSRPQLMDDSVRWPSESCGIATALLARDEPVLCVVSCRPKIVEGKAW